MAVIGVGWRGHLLSRNRKGHSSASGSCCAATAVCHYSGKKATFPDDSLESGLCLSTSIAELNVLSIAFPSHCLHLLAFIGNSFHTNVAKIWCYGRTFPLLPFLLLVSCDRRCPAFYQHGIGLSFSTYHRGKQEDSIAGRMFLKEAWYLAKKKEALYEHIQNNRYIACFQSTINP